MNNIDTIYKPRAPWHTYDFVINSYYWETVGFHKACQIRLDNLKDTCRVFSKNKLVHWLYGSTLWGVVKEGHLKKDHDDDLGIMFSDKDLLMNIVRPQLEEIGFELIRVTPGIISFVRDYRYIDICLFCPRFFGRLGYGHNSVSSHFFSRFDVASLEGNSFPVPADAKSLLKVLYEPSFSKRVSIALNRYLSPNLFIKRSKNFIVKIKEKHIALVEKNKFGRGPFFEFFSFLSNFSVKTLSIEEFLNLCIEPPESFNWRWRYRHLSLVTDDCRISLIGELVAYLAKPEIRKVINESVVESNTSVKFHTKNNLDMRFWWSGNNYFWYCVKYGFRKNVVKYTNANSYIRKISKPQLFSAEYYESLESMNDNEIADFLMKHPLIVENGCVTSGKHRVFAMIGRLASGKSYIPFKVILT